MKTLDRYLALIFARNLLGASLGFAALLMFQGLIFDLFDHRYPSNQVWTYHLLNLPQILIQMSPPAVLLATVLTLSGLSRTNELIAAFSIGVGLKRIVSLIVTLVFIFSCLILIAQDRILPPFYKKRATYYQREMLGRQDFFLDLKQDKIWYRSGNLIYNLQRFDPATQTIHGMTVYTFDPAFNLLQVVRASRSEFTPKGWKLHSGNVTLFNHDDPFPMTKGFAQKDLPITETPRDFQEIDKEVDALRFKELYRYIGRMKSAGADTKALEVKLHSRVSLSFIPLVMCFLGVPFSTRGRREGGAARDLGLCLMLTFFYWLFYSVGLSLGTNGALPPWLAAWLPSTFFAVMAVALIVRQKQ